MQNVLKRKNMYFGEQICKKYVHLDMFYVLDYSENRKIIKKNYFVLKSPKKNRVLPYGGGSGSERYGPVRNFFYALPLKQKVITLHVTNAFKLIIQNALLVWLKTKLVTIMS